MKAQNFELVRYDADEGRFLIGKILMNTKASLKILKQEKRKKLRSIFMLELFSLAHMILLITM